MDQLCYPDFEERRSMDKIETVKWSSFYILPHLFRLPYHAYKIDFSSFLAVKELATFVCSEKKPLPSQIQLLSKYVIIYYLYIYIFSLCIVV